MLTISAHRLDDYATQQGLRLDPAALQTAVATLQSVWDAAKPLATENLFRYPVPKLSADGACSLVEELADEPYDLAPWFGGESHAARVCLAGFHALVEAVNHEVEADWLGIYRKVGAGENACLLKLAYRGLPSRAEFPLTEAFAASSNNSRVGLTGKGALINDVAAWRSAGGSYYECDPKVRSEVCLPVIDASGQVLGILDAESSQKDFFDAKRQTWLAALAIVLATVFAEMPALAKTSPAV